MSAPLPILNDLVKSLQGRADLIAAASGDEWWAGGGQREGKLGPWSTLLLDGLVFPAVLRGYDDPGACGMLPPKGNLRYRVDSQKVRGQSGHKLNVEAYEPARLVLTFRLWRAEQWAAFRAFLPQISPRNKNTKAAPRRFRVSHPVLAVYGISEVFIHDIALPSEADSRFVQEITMEVIEVWDLKDTGTKTVKQANGQFQGLVAAPFKVNSPVPTVPALQNVPLSQQAAALPKLTLTQRQLPTQPYKFPLDPRAR